LAASFKNYIGIDCIALPNKFSGAAYYIINFTRNVLKSERSFPVIVFCKPAHKIIFEAWLNHGDKIITIPLKNRAQQLFFYEFQLRQLLEDEHVILFQAMHYICPQQSKKYRIVTTFHDLGFLLFPKNYPVAKRIYFGKRLKIFLNRSDMVIAVSQPTKNSLAAHFPQFNNKTKVIYPGVDHFENGSRNPDTDKFILTVNSFEKRKNIPFLIRLFENLKNKYNLPHKFIIIGHPNNGYSEIIETVNKTVYKDEIIIRKSVNENELIRHYRQADFFLNASEYEGFGFTSFESIYQSCPSFIYQTEVTKSIFGNHKYLIENYAIDEWSEKIINELQNGFAEKISKQQLAHLTWEMNAEKTITWYNTMLEKGNNGGA